MASEITKTVDKLGRIVLPKEIRKRMNIDAGTKILLCESDGKLTIKIITPKCKICGSSKNVNDALSLCEICITKVKQY